MSVMIFTQLDEIADGGAELLSKNNVLTEQHSDDTKTYTYTYDGDYPLTCIRGISSYYFKYIGKPDPAPAI